MSNPTQQATPASLDRRAFVTSFGGLAGAALVGGNAEAFTLARPTRQVPPEAVGLLYDSTLCIGCKMCVGACRTAHKLPDVPLKPGEPEELNGHTINVIKKYAYGTGKTKDSATDGYAFMKRQCLHCADPSCVSICPNSAMHKDPVTGIVTHDPDACMGCRYCSYGCPFGAPQFDLDQVYGRINKCDMCVDLQRTGGIPACADVCPTGATLFGRLADLQAEADRRLSLAPGTTYKFAHGKLSAPKREHAARIAKYEPKTYGQTDGGGDASALSRRRTVRQARPAETSFPFRRGGVRGCPARDLQVVRSADRLAGRFSDIGVSVEPQPSAGRRAGAREGESHVAQTASSRRPTDHLAGHHPRRSGSDRLLLHREAADVRHRLGRQCQSRLSLGHLDRDRRDRRHRLRLRRLGPWRFSPMV